MERSQADIYCDLPVDYLDTPEMQKELGYFDFLTVSFHYGFSEGEDVMRDNFALFDRYNGYRSKFIHPVVRYYPKKVHKYPLFRNKCDLNEEESTFRSQKYTEIKDTNTEKYILCTCGRFERFDHMRKFTICRICHYQGTCGKCGRQDLIKWFKENDSCRVCVSSGKSQSMEDLLNERQKGILCRIEEDKASNYHLEHHITEDINVSFIYTKKVHPSIDEIFKTGLERFLNTVKDLNQPRLSVIKENNDRWQHNSKLAFPQYSGVPIQFRYWSFDTHIILKTPNFPGYKVLFFEDTVGRILSNEILGPIVNMTVQQLENIAHG